MKNNQHTTGQWQPERSFWIIHLFAPLVVSVFLLTLLETTQIDLWLADRWFALEGGEWSFRDHWIAYTLIHHHGKQLVIAFALSLVGLLVYSKFSGRLSQWRRPMGYLLTCLIVLPAIVSELKHFMTIPCPWYLSRYGGELIYQHNFTYPMAKNAGGNCFPSGHASGGFALVAMYFAVYRKVSRPALFLLPGLLIGWIFALGQQARGAHFLSHDLTTLSICWFGALLLFLWIKPYKASIAANTASTGPDEVDTIAP